MADETIGLQININSNGDKTLGDLKDAIDDVKNSSDDLAKTNAKVDDSIAALQKEAEGLGKEWGDMGKKVELYQSIALKAGKESPVGKEAIKKAAELKREIDNVTASVDILSKEGNTLRGVLDVGGLAVGGFGAFQGALALAGSETQAFEETIKKLVAAQSVLQGIEQIRLATEKESQLMLLARNVQTKVATAGTLAYAGAQKVLALVTGTGTKAMKIFRIALASTGIGLLVIGLGLLIANFDKVSATVKKVGKAIIDHLTAPFRFVTDLLGLTSEAERKTTEASEKAAAKRKKIAEKELKTIAKVRKGKIKEFARMARAEKELNEQTALLLDREIQLRSAQGKDISELSRKALVQKIEALKSEQKIENDRIKFLQDSFEREMTIKAKQGSLIAQVGLKALEGAKFLDEERLENQKKALDALEFDLELFDAKATETERKEAVKRREARNAQAEKDKAAADKHRADKIAAEIAHAEREMAIVQTQEDVRISLIKDATQREIEEKWNAHSLKLQQLEEQGALTAEMEAALQQQTLEAVAEVQANHDAELAAKKAEDKAALEATQKEDKAKELENETALQEAKLQIAASSIEGLMSLNNILTKDAEKQAKINKKLALLQLGIDTGVALAGIVKQASTNPASLTPPLLIADIAMRTAAVLANVAKAKQMIQSMNVSGVSASVSGGSATASASQGAAINPVSNTSTQLASEPTQVFVTETDITTTQNRVNVIESAATF